MNENKYRLVPIQRLKQGKGDAKVSGESAIEHEERSPYRIVDS